MRTSPTFYDNGKCAFGFEVFETERRKSEMMLLKSYATFCNQQLQILKKCCKSKNPNLWLQKKVHFEKEM